MTQNDRLSEQQISDLMEKLRDPADARAFLREAGLIEESGQLAAPYRTPTMRVELTYFLDTGRFYDQGFFDVREDASMPEIWRVVEQARESFTLPGLNASSRNYVILVSAPGHPHDHPRLLFP